MNVNIHRLQINSINEVRLNNATHFEDLYIRKHILRLKGVSRAMKNFLFIY